MPSVTRKEVLKQSISDNLSYSKVVIEMNKHDFNMMNQNDYENLCNIFHEREEKILKTKYSQKLLSELMETDYQISLKGKIIFTYSHANFMYQVILNNAVYSEKYKEVRFRKPLTMSEANEIISNLVDVINNRYIEWGYDRVIWVKEETRYF